MKKPQRKYQGTWKQIKDYKIVHLTLENVHLYSNSQKQKQLKTIRKAIQKEKYYDLEFHRKYPNSKLSSEMNVAEGTIKITLINDTTDVKELF